MKYEKSTNKSRIIGLIEKEQLKPALPSVKVGDTVRLGVEIKEGEKTRVQAFEGVVIAEHSNGLNRTITVRRVLQGVGIERCFLLNSPKVKTIEIIRSSKVRRAKLYYLRNLSGKATRLKQKFN